MPLRSLQAYCILGWLLCNGCALAAGPDASPPPARLWSGLILATNPAHPAPVSDRLRGYAGKLRRIFGYNQFELIGESSQRMDGAVERWLIPSKDFYMSFKSHDEPGARGSAKLTLFQARRELAEFEAHLSPESPLFIRGPQYAGGQLLLVVHVINTPEGPVEAAHLERAPVGVVIPGPVITGTPHKDKTLLLPAGPILIPRQQEIPTPGPHFEPPFKDSFGPGPAGDNARFSPKAGDLEQKPRP